VGQVFIDGFARSKGRVAALDEQGFVIGLDCAQPTLVFERWRQRDELALRLFAIRPQRQGCRHAGLQARNKSITRSAASRQPHRLLAIWPGQSGSLGLDSIYTFENDTGRMMPITLSRARLSCMIRRARSRRRRLLGAEHGRADRLKAKGEPVRG
jgi:hypothetical protein